MQSANFAVLFKKCIYIYRIVNVRVTLIVQMVVCPQKYSTVKTKVHHEYDEQLH